MRRGLSLHQSVNVSGSKQPLDRVVLAQIDGEHLRPHVAGRPHVVRMVKSPRRRIFGDPPSLSIEFRRIGSAILKMDLRVDPKLIALGVLSPPPRRSTRLRNAKLNLFVGI